MPYDFKRNLGKYAEVAVKVALNVQPGQRVLIGRPSHGVYGIPIELAPLVRLITAKSYDAGARLVDVIWNDDELRRIRFEHADPKTIEEFPTWRSAAAIECAEAGDAMLSLYAEDPALLEEQDPELISRFTRANLKHMERYFQLATVNNMNWAVMTAPIAGWAEKIFPKLTPKKAMDKTWDTLFDICRIKCADPVDAWKQHVKDMAARSDYMNKKQYTALRIKAGGTNLTVGLPKGQIWTGTRTKSRSGIEFTANVPSEEIFTMPDNKKTDGYVMLSKPLHYGGRTAEGLRVTFKNGKVVDAKAEKGVELARKIFDTDEGARRLGEIALVPHSSPISQTGLIFHNTLIDENASSHIAFGQAYRYSIKDGEKMDDAQFDKVGGNTSLIHIDCMIGTGDTDIDGVTAGGAKEPVFRVGEWAYKV
jgi:aminopeptidase